MEPNAEIPVISVEMDTRNISIALAEELVDTQLTLERTAKKIDQMIVRTICMPFETPVTHESVIDAWLGILEWEISCPAHFHPLHAKDFAAAKEYLLQRKQEAIALHDLTRALEEVESDLAAETISNPEPLQSARDTLVNAFSDRDRMIAFADVLPGNPSVVPSSCSV